MNREKRLIASDWQAMRLPQLLLFGFVWKSNSSSELDDSKRGPIIIRVHMWVAQSTTCESIEAPESSTQRVCVCVYVCVKNKADIAALCYIAPLEPLLNVVSYF